MVTGASAGIGLELAKCFARDHHRLILVARREDKLKTLADQWRRDYGTETHLYPQDLSRPQAAQSLFEATVKAGLVVDILVNNAGFGLYGHFAELTIERQLEMMRLNMLALTHLTKLYLDGMLKRKQGKILNVASTAAFQPGPLMAVYYATKAYVLHFSEAIANELKGRGITVTCLCPGPTRSEFQKTANLNNVWLFRLVGMMEPEAVAHAGYQGLMKGKRIVIPGLVNRLFAFSTRLVPRGMITDLIRLIQEEKL